MRKELGIDAKNKPIDQNMIGDLIQTYAPQFLENTEDENPLSSVLKGFLQTEQGQEIAMKLLGSLKPNDEDNFKYNG